MRNPKAKDLLEIGFRFGQELLRNDDAESVYVIGSQVSEKTHHESDLDLVVKGLNPGRYFKILSRGARKFPKDLDSLDLIPYRDADDYIKNQLQTSSVEIKEDQTLDEFINALSRISKKLDDLKTLQSEFLTYLKAELSNPRIGSRASGQVGPVGQVNGRGDFKLLVGF